MGFLIWNPRKCLNLISFSFIWIPIKYFNYFSAVIDFTRQNLTSVDVRFWYDLLLQGVYRGDNETNGFSYFEIIINVLILVLVSFIFIWIPIKYFNYFSAGTVIARQNLTSVDVRFWRVKTVPAMKGLIAVHLSSQIPRPTTSSGWKLNWFVYFVSKIFLIFKRSIHSQKQWFNLVIKWI